MRPRSFPVLLTPRPTRWRAALALLLVGVTGCAPTVPGLSPASNAQRVSQSGAGELRIGKATKGDLSGALTFSGELRPRAQVSVVPRVQSVLDRVSVEVGARVREGEPLAELNRAAFEAQVLQAQAAQAAAEARLAQLKSDPRPEALAQAQANLRAAQARFKALEARASSEPTALQRRVDDARAALTRAQAAPATGASTQVVTQAETTLTQARNRLNALLSDPARQNDRAALDAARDDVRRAEDTLNALRTPSNPQAAVEQARRELADADAARGKRCWMGSLHSNSTGTALA